MLKRFLEESTTYAESILDLDDVEDVSIAEAQVCSRLLGNSHVPNVESASLLHQGRLPSEREISQKTAAKTQRTDILKENNPSTMASRESVLEIHSVSPASTIKRLSFTVKGERPQAIEAPEPRLDVTATDARRYARPLRSAQERANLNAE